MSIPEAVRWSEDGQAVELLDQTRLPEEEQWLALRTAEEIAAAIREMRVRGAPAIGIAAAMGLAIDLNAHGRSDPEAFWARFDEASALLAATRPTAVNLFAAIERMRSRAAELRERTPGEAACQLYAEATAIRDEDREMCGRIGELGLAVIPPGGASLLTHCNAGALATGGMGTALAPIYCARERGIPLRVFAGETRPLFQGSRLTAWELMRAGVDVTVVPDSVAAVLMRQRRVDLVIVGADRIAANGDVANKVGTYGLAVLAQAHGLPFYVAAPATTLDLGTAAGGEIVIEERDPNEVRRGFGQLTAPEDVAVYAPAFDVTPAHLVTAIITDRGILRPPYEVAIRDALGVPDLAEG